MRCFQAAMKWQRKELQQELFRSLSLRLPYIGYFRNKNVLVKLVYSAIMLALIPLLTVLWLVNAALHMLFFPYRYWAAYVKPRNLKGPGERNIQGVHNAFTKHLNLSPELHIQCVNDWVGILYGEEALRGNRMENYVDVSKFKQQRAFTPSTTTAQLRSTLTIARETLSQNLGCY